MTCEPSELAELAKCFQCLTDGQTEAIDIYLLCQWENTASGENFLTDEDGFFILDEEGSRIIVNL